MAIRRIRPEPGQILSVCIETPFLLAGDQGPLSSTYLMLSAGQVPAGAMTVLFDFDESDYGKEMAAAVRETINAINERWGLNGDWQPREFEFTGDRAEPFRKREQS